MDEVRIDRWLWAARCFKTRSQATAACDNGRAEVDGARAKPGKRVRPGMVVDVRTAGGLRRLAIVALADKRGSATIAATLYEDRSHELPPPPEDPLEGVGPHRNSGPTGRVGPRPTKKDRRRLTGLS